MLNAKIKDLDAAKDNSTLNVLISDIQLKLLSLITIPTLHSIRQTSKWFYRQSKAKALWQLLIRRDFPGIKDSYKSEYQNDPEGLYKKECDWYFNEFYKLMNWHDNFDMQYLFQMEAYFQQFPSSKTPLGQEALRSKSESFRSRVLEAICGDISQIDTAALQTEERINICIIAAAQGSHEAMNRLKGEGECLVLAIIKRNHGALDQILAHDWKYDIGKESLKQAIFCAIKMKDIIAVKKLLKFAVSEKIHFWTLSSAPDASPEQWDFSRKDSEGIKGNLCILEAGDFEECIEYLAPRGELDMLKETVLIYKANYKISLLWVEFALLKGNVVYDVVKYLAEEFPDLLDEAVSYIDRNPEYTIRVIEITIVTGQIALAKSLIHKHTDKITAAKKADLLCAAGYASDDFFLELIELFHSEQNNVLTDSIESLPTALQFSRTSSKINYNLNSDQDEDKENQPEANKRPKP